jgi:hypothetical protein
MVARKAGKARNARKETVEGAEATNQRTEDGG